MLRKWYHKMLDRANNTQAKARVRRQCRPARLRTRLLLEALEDRCVPASFTVTSALDDGSAGTLRAAINQANASSDPTNTISFDLGAGAHTITLSQTQGPLSLNNSNSTTIQGTGADQLFISGNHATRVFFIGSAATVELNDLSIVDGFSSVGGGIYNSGNLIINDSTLSGNSSGSGGGGGIFNYFSATAAINNSTLSGNSASSGGGIFNVSATVAINNSTLSGNSATAVGGGIYNLWSATATINNSTLTGNWADSTGGGIFNDSATVTINNSTLFENSASTRGGGISNGNSATATINNSTLFENSATVGGGGIYNYFSATATINNSTLSGNLASYGGGIYNYSATAKLGNSIVAANTAGYNPDVLGPFNSLGHNLIGIADGSSGFTNGDLMGSAAAPLDPKLDILASNGGLTLTMALLAGSPAIDAGSNALVPIDPSTGLPYTTDQRGNPRIVGARVDIGAYEAGVQQSSQTITFNALPDKTYGEADFALTGMASSGLPVSYSAIGSATVYQDINGNWFAHLSGAGTATITASQVGDSAYSAAPDVSQTFTIAQATTDFSNLTMQQVVLESNTTILSGQLTSSTIVPVGQSVTITLDGVSQSTTVGANGSFSISFATGALGVGEYTISYSYAGDNNFTAASATGSLTVAYGDQLLFNNNKPVHSGACLPIKLALTDAEGANVSSSTIAVTAIRLEDSNGNSMLLTSKGNANPDDLFRYDSRLGGYIFNLDTTGLAAGTYTLYYSAGDDPTLHSLSFVVR